MVGFLTAVLLRGLPTRHDIFQEDRPLIFDKRHQIHVILATNDEDALAGVTVGVRVFQDVEQVARLDVKDDIIEPDAALLPDHAAVLMLNRDLEGEREVVLEWDDIVPARVLTCETITRPDLPDGAMMMTTRTGTVPRIVPVSRQNGAT